MVDDTDHVHEVFQNLPQVPRSEEVIAQNRNRSSVDLLNQIQEIKEELDIILEEVDREAEAAEPPCDLIFSEGIRLNKNEIACLNNRPKTDMGNAERLCDQYGQYIRYCFDTKEWFVWHSIDGRWRRDDREAMGRIGKEVIRRILVEASRAGFQEEVALSKWALTCECRTHLQGMLDLARFDPRVTIASTEWDKDNYLINLNNGTFDLRTFALRGHQQSDLISRTVGYDYDPDATCPQWLAFLDRIFRSRPDKTEIIGYLQRCFGYALTGSTAEEIVLMMWGGGLNGKSVLLSVLQAMGGEYACSVDGSAFIVSRNHDSKSARPELARLQGMRIVCASENPADTRLDETAIKKFTSCDDTVETRQLYKDTIQWKPQFTLFWAFNHVPLIEDRTYSLWRRIKLIPFEETIPTCEIDIHLSGKLKQELPGIFNWAVAGLREYNNGGLREPEAVRMTTKEYRDDQDILADFIAAKIILQSDDEKNGTKIIVTKDTYVVHGQVLYNTYVDYSNQNERGVKNLISMQKFNRIFKESKLNGVSWSRNERGKYYMGFRLRY